MTRPPDFLIAGAARAGTSALAVFLSEHPDVYFSKPKEPHFLAHAGAAPNYQGLGDQENMNDRVIHDSNEWLNLFASAPHGALLGEGSVSTLAFPEPSIANIKQWCPDAKIIVCLREPVARLESAYLYLRSRGYEPCESLEAALAEEPQRISDDWHHLWHYRRLSDYPTLLKPFFEAFASDQIHLVISEELQADAADQLAAVCDFLDLDAFTPEQTDRPINTGGQIVSGPLGTAARLVASSPALKTAIRTVVPDKLRHRLQNQVMVRSDEAPDVPGLYDEFEPTRRWVRETLGRDIPLWEAS